MTNTIPDDLYYSYLDMHFNNSKKSYGIDDKNYYDKLLPNLKQPETLLRKINGHYYDIDYNLKQLEEILSVANINKSILKPSIVSQGGSGIVFIDSLSTKKAKELLLSSNNFIVQKIVTQHKALRDLHPSSLNTIRVMSLLFKGKVHILSSVLRIGVSGSNVDNASSGGIVVGIDKNGCLKNKAYSSKERKTYIRHPDTDIVFESYKIPNYDEIVDIVKQEAIKFPDFRMISWDLALDENEDVLFIEFNLKSG